MRESITQEFDYGCGVACFAFALGLTYKQAEGMLGEKQAQSDRFWVKDFTAALNRAGKKYESKHIKPYLYKKLHEDGTIVLVRRSKDYPAGHYLIRYQNYWMDPWINLPEDRSILNAKSGFRKRLPGSPMYVIFAV
jgi:hypothetical protein